MATDTQTRNKEIVAQFCTTFSTGDVDAILDYFAADALWHITGSIATSGDYDMVAFREFVTGVGQIAEGGAITFTYVDSIAEGDRVAAEITSTAVFVNGRTYSNEYSWHVEIRDGKIWRLREYQDTAHTVAVLAP
ncbi:ketosteroid isomerase-like protein [Rhodococcus sp. 27YEA15]|uniref:nuclear transport factor 2 family protein n=1 Tax=Rhodococcus sp. 27YEA15 TaxID=3156259 RepID=UPI003C7C1C5A